MQHRVVRRVRIGSRKRDHRDGVCGSTSDERMICLLELFPPGLGDVQRRAIQVQVDGEMVWREFEIVTSFASADEATVYATEHGVDDVDL
jgi:hypothetical protein